MIIKLEIHVIICIIIIQFDDNLVATVDKLCLEPWQTNGTLPELSSPNWQTGRSHQPPPTTTLDTWKCLQR